jgi:hypothetical protein
MLQTKAKSVAAWRQTLSFDSDNGNAANNLAWVLARSADAYLRNGEEAVVLAKRDAQLAGGENPGVLRTLAAALGR